jgi:hypothetical protein
MQYMGVGDIPLGIKITFFNKEECSEIGMFMSIQAEYWVKLKE